MVRVPRITQDRVKKTSPRDVNLSTNVPLSAFGGGSTALEKDHAARGLARDISELVLRERQKAEDAAFNKHSAELAQLEINLTQERERNLGENALDYPERESQLRDEGQQKIFDSVKSRRVKNRLKAEALSFAIRGQNATQRHVNTERKRFEKSSLEAAIKNNRIVALNTGNDNEIKKSIIVNKNLIEKSGKLNGLSKDEIALNVFEETTKTHVQNIDRLMGIDTDLAKQYYEDHKDEIDQAILSKPKLNKNIAAALKINFDEISDELARKQIEGTLTPEDIRAVSHRKSQGGIGAKEALTWLKRIDAEQSREIEKILKYERAEEEDDAAVYIDMVDNLVDDRIDKYVMRQKLIEFGTRLDKDERKQLNKMTEVLKSVETGPNKIPNNLTAFFPSLAVINLFRKSKDQIKQSLEDLKMDDIEVKNALRNVIDFHLNEKDSDPTEYQKKTQERNEEIIRGAAEKKNPDWSKYKIGDAVQTPTGTQYVVDFYPDGEPEVDPDRSKIKRK